MEDIIRKLDQLRTKLSKENVIKMTGTAQSYSSKWDQVNYFKAIEVFKKKVENLLNSTSGISLSEKTKNSIITFLNYLNHPELKNKSALFEEMKDKYKAFKKLNFLSIQSFDDMLNKCEIKLGAVTEKLKKWKSPEELKKELDEEKMADIIRKVLAEKKEVPVEKPKPQTDIKEEVQKAVKSGMKDLISSIRDQISSVNVNPQQSKEIDMPIDPAKFAEISQKAIDKVSKDIETGEAKTPKKVQFKIGDLKDLADEIE